MDQLLQLAIITNDHFRAETLATIVQSVGWRLVPCVDNPRPNAWLQRQQVDVALVDLDIPNAIVLLAELAQMVPGIPLLALATPQHLVELQDALLAGASSFVPFPVEAEPLTQTVLRALENDPQRKDGASPRGRLVAVAGLKGGVGRTTLATNLAIGLRKRQDGDVVLVEAHHGLGDVALMLNLMPHHTLASLEQEPNIDADVIQGHLQTHSSQVKVLAAPPDLAQLVQLSPDIWHYILDLLTKLAPYVIVDTAAIVDSALSEVLTLADDIVVVTGPDLASLRSAVLLLQTLEEEENVHAQTHVVLNRAGVKGGVSEAASRDQVGEQIAAALPDDPALVTFALNRGVPFVLSHPRSILSAQVHNLLDQIFRVAPGSKGSVKKSSRRRLPFMKRAA